MSEPSAEPLRESLDWALSKIAFPQVPEDGNYLSDGRFYTGCPGCRVIWHRDMTHKDGCAYVKALALRDAAKEQP